MYARKYLAILLAAFICAAIFSCAIAETGGEFHIGMSVQEVEAIWGKPERGNILSLSGTIRWYHQNGHTLICAFDWCDPEKGTWSDIRTSENDVWALAEWIEFDEKNQRVGGNVPEDEDVCFVMRQFIYLPSEEIPRAHDIGSGFSIPAKITSDGWIVEDGIGPETIDCLDRGWLYQMKAVPLGIWGFILGWTK